MSDSIFGANSYLGGSWDALKRLPAGVLRHLSDNPEQMARGVLGPAYKPTMGLANIMGPQADVAGMVRDAGGVMPALERGQYGTAARDLGLAAAAVPFMFLPGTVGGVKEVVKGVKHGDELIGIHNLRPEALAHADKLGGLPVPSIAVTKTGAPMENFGDISLIAGDDLVKPAAKNPIFASDAYTPRYPQVNTFYSKADNKKIDDYFSEPFGTKGTWESKRDVAGRDYAYGGDFFNELQDKGLAGLWQNDMARVRFLYDKGNLPDYRKYNTKENGAFEFKAEVRARMDGQEKEYGDWLAGLNERVGVAPEEKIFKGYTNMGNRRYAPHTMENVVKEMKGGIRGGENFNYGLGSLRAAVTPKFKNKAGIKAKRDKIISHDEMEVAKTKLNEEFFSLAKELEAIDPYGYGYDVIMARLAEVPKYGTRRTLNEYYGDVSESMIKKVDGFLEKLGNSPTEYFEGKPQRSVDLSEFSGALVPSNINKETLGILSKHGIKNVAKYADKADRAKAIRAFPNQMFGLAGLGALGLGLGGSNE